MLTYFNSIKVQLKLTTPPLKRLVFLYFNSIKVQLKPKTPHDIRQHQTYFNSIKVQLKLLAFYKAYFDTLFQFHKGTIKTVVVHRDGHPLRHFNSIKVQLKP